MPCYHPRAPNQYQPGCCLPSGAPGRSCATKCSHRDPFLAGVKVCEPEYRPYPSYCSVVRRYSTMTYCPAPSPPRWKDHCKSRICAPMNLINPEAERAMGRSQRCGNAGGGQNYCPNCSCPASTIQPMDMHGAKYTDHTYCH